MLTIFIYFGTVFVVRKNVYLSKIPAKVISLLEKSNFI